MIYNITQNSNEFDKFKKIFTIIFYIRYLCQKILMINTFWSSIFFCFDETFITKTLNEVELMISTLKQKIIESNNITKKYNNDKIISNQNNPYFLELICNFLKINFSNF